MAKKTHEEALSIAVPPKIRRVAKVGAFRLSLRTKDQKVDPAPYLDSRQVTRLNSPQAQHQLYLAQSNVLADLDPDQLPASHKREGQDWYAVFNPRARRVLDVDLMHTLPHQSVVCCVRFSLDGRYVATGSNRVALVHDVETGDLVASLDHFAGLDEGGDMYIRSVCFSSDGRYLATGNEDKTVCVWDLAINKIMHTFTGHEEDVYNLEFARNGRFIASGSGDRTVRLWDLESNSQVARFTGEDAITSVSISPDSLYVAAGSLDKSVRVWDVQDGRIVARFEGEEGHKNSVYSVAFVPSGDRLISASLDKTIKMWELPTSTHPGKCVRTFEGHKDFALNVTMTPRGDWMLSGSKDRSTMLWDPHTVIAVASSPTNGVFATASGDKRARIWKYDRYIGP
ncbi:general transcription repressor [Neodidymelliopsis sp. IMI 364377]|nr:general transcription repressor [Neodidymelliopsis sp. IMI 364377]